MHPHVASIFFHTMAGYGSALGVLTVPSENPGSVPSIYARQLLTGISSLPLPLLKVKQYLSQLDLSNLSHCDPSLLPQIWRFSLGHGCLRRHIPCLPSWFKGDMGNTCFLYAVSPKHPLFTETLAQQTRYPLLDYK